MRKRMVLSAAIAGLGVTVAATANDYNYRTVAKTGDLASGAFGGVFTDFGRPSLNADGLVAFTAHTNSGLTSSGMWRTTYADPESPQILAGTLFTIFGVPESIRYGDFNLTGHTARINDQGNVGFNAPLKGGPDSFNNAQGIFRLIGDSLEVVAMPNDPAPGAGGGVTFDFIIDGVTFNNSNLAGFRGYLQGPGVNINNREALYMSWFGGPTLIKRSGSPAPGVNGTFGNNPEAGPMLIGHDGRFGFVSDLNVNGGTVTSYWTGWPGLWTMQAKGGDISPMGWPFIEQQPLTSKRAALSLAGTLFYHDATAFGDLYSGLWYAEDGALSLVAAAGTPGPFSVYDTVVSGAWSVAGDGTAVFRASFPLPVPANANSAVIMRKPGQSPIVIAREGDPAPGYWDGVTFGDMAHTVATMIDDTGRVYFYAHLQGPGINNSNSLGIWAVDADGTPSQVVQKGQMIDLGDGVERQVVDFGIDAGVSMHSGRRPAINNNGDAALRLEFTDGTIAVVIAERKCVGDLNNDGAVNVSDLLTLLGAWGGCDNCQADMNKDGAVDVADMLALLAAWGACP